MSDIISQLEEIEINSENAHIAHICGKAAETIEALLAENARLLDCYKGSTYTVDVLIKDNAKLRAALKPFTELPCARMARFSGAPDDYAASEMIPYGIIRAAPAAMGETE